MAELRLDLWFGFEAAQRTSSYRLEFHCWACNQPALILFVLTGRFVLSLRKWDFKFAKIIYNFVLNGRAAVGFY